MSNETPIQIVSVERIDGTDIIVEFSDGTYAELSAAEVIACVRERRPTHPQENDENEGESA